MVLKTLQLCKDVEFVMMLHLLDEILPLFYHYTVIFRSGKLDNYLTVMQRFAILFICWQRRHCDKSTLSMLCDIRHQKESFPEYYTTKRDWLTVFTEKKVEVWHSKLRNNISPTDAAEVISKRAKMVSGTTQASSFQQHFVPDYQRGFCEKDHTMLAGQTAEFLLKKFQEVSTNLNKTKLVNYPQTITYSTLISLYI